MLLLGSNTTASQPLYHPSDAAAATTERPRTYSCSDDWADNPEVVNRICHRKMRFILNSFLCLLGAIHPPANKMKKKHIITPLLCADRCCLHGCCTTRDSYSQWHGRVIVVVVAVNRRPPRIAIQWNWNEWNAMKSVNTTNFSFIINTSANIFRLIKCSNNRQCVDRPGDRVGARGIISLTRWIHQQAVRHSQPANVNFCHIQAFFSGDGEKLIVVAPLSSDSQEINLLRL